MVTAMERMPRLLNCYAEALAETPPPSEHRHHASYLPICRGWNHRVDEMLSRPISGKG